MFTTAAYAAWPDSFEQSARDKKLRAARERQMALFTSADYEPAHCACQMQLRMCPGCYEKLQAKLAQEAA